MHTLNPPFFRPLPLGQIRPLGWLKQQLRLQANGISGHLDEFWPDICDSQWFGGDSEGWERAPYWLDGVIPLAYVLDDPMLKDKVERYMDYILDHQEPDGWMGPRIMRAAANQQDQARYDLWAQFLTTKVLIQYAQASGETRALDAIERQLRMIEGIIDRSPLFDWAQFRWFEALIAIYELAEQTNSPWLLDLAIKLHAQGFDWGAFFTHWPLTEPTAKGHWTYMGHVVNNAMALKSPALWWRLSGQARDRAAIYDMLAKLDRYHGMVTGLFSGDECLSGQRPTQGTELCAVVEYTYSLEVLISLLGDPAFGDRLEKIMFNALPATFSSDMWSHQYDQQVNQVQCSADEPRIWTTNGPESNLFGVEPNYGCCTANLSQGWPKFAAHLWMKSHAGQNNEGLAAVAYAPSEVLTKIQDIPVSARLETEYPFRDTLHFYITADKPTRFPLWLRIPAWASGAQVQVGAEPAQNLTPGDFARVERTWSQTTEVVLTLPMVAKLTQRPNNAVAIERGPLVYSLKIGEEWRRVHEDLPYRELPHADWEVYATTPWNYALDAGSEIEFEERPVGKMPFSPQGAPVMGKVQGRRLTQWGMTHTWADDVPTSPAASSEPLETLTLIPYGCTNLRITEFPVLEE